MTSSRRTSGSDLHLHFQESLGTQREALCAWSEHLLLNAEKPLKIDEVQTDLCKGINLPYAIQVEKAELQAAFQDAVGNGKFVEGPIDHFQVSQVRRDVLQAVQKESEYLDERIRQRWFAEVQKDYPELAPPVLEELWEGLGKFITIVVRDLRQRAESLEDKGWNYAREIFSEGHPLLAVAEVAYPAFLTSDDSDYQQLFRRYLAHALFAFRTSVSEVAAKELRGNLRGRALYLDTNVLFPAIGLTGDPTFEEGIRGILQLARDAGLKLLVTNRTFEEYEAVLGSLRRRAYSDTAPLYILRRQRHGLDKAFLIQRSKSFLTIEEFFERYRDLRVVLDDAEINTSGIQEERLQETERCTLKEHPVTHLATEVMRSFDKPNKNPKAIEHDAFHLALVASRRQRDTWRETRGWFLTLDNSLARVEQRLSRQTPLSMTVDVWVLTFRQVLPRVESFEAFFAAIVTRQLFPSFYIDREAIYSFTQLAKSDATRKPEEVLGRLARTLPSEQLESSLVGQEDTQALVAALEEMDERQRKMYESVQEYSGGRYQERLTAKDEQLRELDEKQKGTEAELEVIKQGKSKAERRVEQEATEKSVLQKENSVLRLKNDRGSLEGEISQCQVLISTNKANLKGLDRVATACAFTFTGIILAAAVAYLFFGRGVLAFAESNIGWLITLSLATASGVFALSRWIAVGRQARSREDLEHKCCNAEEHLRKLRHQLDQVQSQLTQLERAT